MCVVVFLNKYWTYIQIELPILIINSLKDMEYETSTKNSISFNIVMLEDKFLLKHFIKREL